MLSRPALTLTMLLAFVCLFSASTALAQFRTSYSAAGKQAAPKRAGGGTGSGVRLPGSVYPQFLFRGRVVHWLPEQMPLKVFISRGLTLDGIMDEQLGAPRTNVDSKDFWPDLVAEVIENEGMLDRLEVAEGFIPEHMNAVVSGINYWKPFEKEGLFSYQITNDPSEADIYVFFTHHFVNKLGMGLFQNDIRGYTAQRLFEYQKILAGGTPQLRPVVILLRTTDQRGNPMSADRMRASAGHEMGHALGIIDHSTNPYDLMSVYYGRGVLSNSDAATIRFLYKQRPFYIP